jgi:solute carrier family 25 folate transporter 32
MVTAEAPEPASSSSHMLAGAGAGFIATALLHPLDLIKTRMHVQEIGGRRLPHYANLWHAFRSIVRLEGAAGLYQGVGPNVIGSTLSWAMYMFLYNGLKARLAARAERIPPDQRWSPSWVYVTAATASGVVVSLTMHPVFTIKTRMQLQFAARQSSPAAAAAAPPLREIANLVPINQRDNYASGLVAARRIIREEGFLSLYRGIGPSLFLVSHGAVQFLGYEHIKSFFGARVGNSPRQAGNRMGTAENSTRLAGNRMARPRIAHARPGIAWARPRIAHAWLRIACARPRIAHAWQGIACARPKILAVNSTGTAEKSTGRVAAPSRPHSEAEGSAGRCFVTVFTNPLTLPACRPVTRRLRMPALPPS